MNIKLYTYFLIDILISAIKKEQIQKIPDEIDLKVLGDYAKFHKVENVLFPVLKPLLNDADDEESKKQYYKWFINGIFLDSRQREALSSITKVFEENKIKYIPMKGTLLKSLYPSPDMRQSSDLDILINPEEDLKVKELLEGLGYKSTIFRKTNHDNYEKNVVLLEMHRSLMPPRYSWKEVCNRIEQSFIKSEKGQYQYEMTDEDFYVYLIIHIAKHIKVSGIGIRYIWDIWIYLNAKSNDLNWDKIERRLMEANLIKFENLIKTLSYYWFDKKETDNELVLKLAYFVATSGWVGTKDRAISAEVSDMSKSQFRNKKIKYYTNIIFLPMENMKKKYSVLEKLPALLPVFWIYRIFDILLNKNKNIGKVKNHFKGSSVEYGQNLSDFKKDIGII